MIARSSAWILGFLLPLALVAAPACGDNGIVGKAVPSLEVTESGRPILYDDTIIVSPLLPTHVLLKNTGGAPLTIKDLTIESSSEGAFTLLTSPAAPYDIAPGDSHELTIIYDSTVGGDDPTATIHVQTNRTLDGKNEFVFHAEPEVGGSRIVVQPSVLDFQVVSADTGRTLTLSILNTGSERLEVTQFFLSGHPGFSIEIGNINYAASETTASQGITLPEPLIIDSGSSAQLQVTYTASGAEAAEGQLTFMSNDPTATKGTNVQLFANVAGPCIKVSPQTVDFGGKKVGQLASVDLTISSCGDRDLTISALSITDDGGGVYAIDTNAVGAAPITVPHGDKLTVPVTYLPATVAVLGGDGQPTRDLGNLHISSDAYLAEVDVPLTGFGTDGTCPTAVITCSEPDEVAPQTTMHCSGTGSTASTSIASYAWTITQPSGSTEVIYPSPSSPNITFTANIIGEYTLALKVTDQAGTPSCTDAEHPFIVTSGEGIHVELLWHTPGDSDETDTSPPGADFSVGTDVDLHFMHANATDWFDDYFDAFWYNPRPDWGNPGTTDDPSLDRDDTDGAGPENLNLAVPEQNRCYKIGAHYWDDWDYGDSFATVRVYIYGQLRFHWDDVKIKMGDMWDVAGVCWPSGAVTPTGGTTPSIEHDYPLPPPFGDGGNLLCDGICDDLDFFLCPEDCP
ncbi:MAG: choice-of-anchor D domain-containing protein [Myxococcota bacterium]